jgi:hypothetical protein
VKPKLQWKTQDVGAGRNMKCLLSKAISKEWSQSRRKVMWTANGKAI